MCVRCGSVCTRRVYTVIREPRYAWSSMVSGGGLEPHSALDCRLQERRKSADPRRSLGETSPPPEDVRGRSVCTVYTRGGIMGGMARPELHRRKDGTEAWKVRFRDGGRGSTERSKTFTDVRDAEWFVSLIADVGPKRALEIATARGTSRTSTPSVSDWCTHHIDALSGTQADTL